MANFFRRGKSKIVYTPTVAGTSPTRAEITAGTPLSIQVNSVDGFELTNSPIATPNLNDQFTSQIDGEDTVANSALTFLDDDTATTIRTALAKGTAGYLLLFPYGDVSSKRMEVWKIKSTGANDQWSIGNDPARFKVTFAVTAVPVQNAVVPV